MNYSLVIPSAEVRGLVELAIRVAAGELGIGLPDFVRCVVPNPEGTISGPASCHAWCDPLDATITLVDVERREPRNLVASIFHELVHMADGLKSSSVAEILQSKESSETRAREFAESQIKDLPTYSSGLIAALEHRLHMQRFPEQHAFSMVCAQRELQRIELERFDDYDEAN